MIVEAEGLTRLRWPGEYSDLFVPNVEAEEQAGTLHAALYRLTSGSVMAGVV